MPKQSERDVCTELFQQTHHRAKCTLLDGILQEKRQNSGTKIVRWHFSLRQKDKKFTKKSVKMNSVILCFY